MTVKEYGYEYDASLDEMLWEKVEGKVTEETLWGAICLRSGRDALKAIAREYAPTIVLMPALACDSMSLPFKQYNHTIVYYRLTEQYEIDLSYLRECIPQEKALFLYMDYFGIPSVSDDSLTQLRNDFPNMVFIEDRTHNLLWESKRSFSSEFVMASIRKWVNIPDGGVLWAKNPLKNNQFAEDTSFSTKRLKAQCLRRDYFNCGNEGIKREYRELFSTVSEILDSDKEPSRMSEYSFELLKRVDWGFVRNQRNLNAKRLIEVLKEADVEFIQQESGVSDLYVSFKISNRDGKQKQLSSMGIFNTIIWPLADEQKQVCEVARLTEECMLAAPCDQRYVEDDMEYIGKEMVRIFNE